MRQLAIITIFLFVAFIGQITYELANLPYNQGIVSDTQPKTLMSEPLPDSYFTPVSGYIYDDTARAFVINTGGYGLILYDTVGGRPILILEEEEFVTVLENENTIDYKGLTWVKARTFVGKEGWVARDFLEIEGQP